MKRQRTRHVKCKKPTRREEPYVDPTVYFTPPRRYEFGSFTDLAEKPGVNVLATSVAVPVNISPTELAFPVTSNMLPDDNRAVMFPDRDSRVWHKEGLR